MFDRESQSPRTGRSEHQPVGASGKVLVGECIAEDLVVGTEVLNRQPALGHAGRAAGFEREEWLASQTLRQPATHRTASQPLLLEGRKPSQVLEGEHLA